MARQSLSSLSSFSSRSSFSSLGSFSSVWFRRAPKAWTILAVALLVGCRGASSSNQGSIDITLRSQVTDAIAFVHVTLQSGTLSTPLRIPMAFAGAEVSTILRGLPVSDDYVVTADAVDGNDVVVALGAAASVSVSRGQTSKVIVLLNQPGGATPFFDSAPVIDAITVSSDVVAPGGQATLVGFAHDPDPGQTASLAFAWSVAAGCGTIVDTGVVPGSDAQQPSASRARWTAPDLERDCDITLGTSDVGGLSTSFTFALHVGAASSNDDAGDDSGAAMVDAGAGDDAVAPGDDAASEAGSDDATALDVGTGAAGDLAAEILPDAVDAPLGAEVGDAPDQPGDVRDARDGMDGGIDGEMDAERVRLDTSALDGGMDAAAIDARALDGSNEGGQGGGCQVLKTIELSTAASPVVPVATAVSEQGFAVVVLGVSANALYVHRFDTQAKALPPATVALPADFNLSGIRLVAGKDDYALAVPALQTSGLLVYDIQHIDGSGAVSKLASTGPVHALVLVADQTGDFFSVEEEDSSNEDTVQCGSESEVESWWNVKIRPLSTGVGGDGMLGVRAGVRVMDATFVGSSLRYLLSGMFSSCGTAEAMVSVVAQDTAGAGVAASFAIDAPADVLTVVPSNLLPKNNGISGRSMFASAGHTGVYLAANVGDAGTSYNAFYLPIWAAGNDNPSVLMTAKPSQIIDHPVVLGWEDNFVLLTEGRSGSGERTVSLTVGQPDGHSVDHLLLTTSAHRYALSFAGKGRRFSELEAGQDAEGSPSVASVSFFTCSGE